MSYTVDTVIAALEVRPGEQRYQMKEITRRRYRDILERRYFTETPVTKAQMARDWGLSHSRVHQMEAKLLRMLRHPVRRKELGLVDDGSSLAMAVYHGDNPTGRKPSRAGTKEGGE